MPGMKVATAPNPNDALPTDMDVEGDDASGFSLLEGHEIVPEKTDLEFFNDFDDDFDDDDLD
eukprot:CAMPEP_0119310314 /NCGR_PEP_ID=MMETSP1333-20130426/18762_1 /TAXON_ID=418940 /ORGANISM="Scyphosphaera apsteinii, Strain RCC1455" /LENGTH=61 /DNA_ID=CAMNT_0007314477 /DNA_START=45 /DNA_END=230 /DNA_ORIENTATION=-